MHTRQGAAVPAQTNSNSHSLTLCPSPELRHQTRPHLRDCAAVPEQVWTALDLAYPVEEDCPLTVTREHLAERVAVLMAIGDWRFCKCYRQGATAQHRFLYRLVDTVAANVAADARERAYQGIVFVQEVAR